MTGPRSHRQFLQDIIDACDDCTRFVEGFGFAEFMQDRKTNQAVVGQIEIIGEASNRIPENIRQLAPEIPWGDMNGMRNRLVHEYFAVGYELVWRTVQEDLPALARSIQKILDEAF